MPGWIRERTAEQVEEARAVPRADVAIPHGLSPAAVPRFHVGARRRIRRQQGAICYALAHVNNLLAFDVYFSSSC